MYQLIQFSALVTDIEEISGLNKKKGREHMVVQMIQDDVLLTFKEAMGYLRVSRSTLYRLMWSGQLTGHKVGSTWRFYREDLRACVGREISIVGAQAGIA
ncbi:MAG TPA: helix-turn-helix domain-containing protein [Ktedonobacteraceae bacterium]|nr:helix-turn-helix domain-containing protein [Ktedonobacteraceae bacterium]